MKKHTIIILLTFFIFLSCRSVKENGISVQSSPWHTFTMEFDHALLAENYNQIDFSVYPGLSSLEYDSLQLYKVEELEGFDPVYLFINKNILSNEKGKIISVKLLANGQISECLLSYDGNGTLIDNLTVAYEDLVECESRTFSEINSNRITIRNVDFTYIEQEKEIREKSDTIILQYEITPDLRFVIR